MRKTINALLCIALCVSMLLCTTLPLLAVPFTRSEGDAVYSWHANTQMKIALTFDDGPHPTYTEEILDLLDEYGAKATFFCVGSCVEQYPSVTAAVVARGHELGNHTFDHVNLRASSVELCRGQLRDTERAIYDAAQVTPRLLRPPEGRYSDEVCRAADEMGYKIVLWTVDTRDWAHTTPEAIFENVKENVKSGDIILFHDYVVGSSPTCDALRLVLPYLKERGFKTVTVSELIESP